MQENILEAAETILMVPQAQTILVAPQTILVAPTNSSYGTVQNLQMATPKLCASSCSCLGREVGRAVSQSRAGLGLRVSTHLSFVSGGWTAGSVAAKSKSCSGFKQHAELGIVGVDSEERQPECKQEHIPALWAAGSDAGSATRVQRRVVCARCCTY